ncbi:MAG: hypothetical protein JKY37_20415 [Nannocystaceae bacterium]|nr:hypothetical protein [Nannocystaceae bacterium]
MRSVALLAALLILPACDKKSDDKADATAKKSGDANAKGDGEKGGDSKDGDKDSKDTAAAAGGGGASAVTYIPESATILVGVDIATLVKNPLYTANKADFDKDFTKALDAMSKCEVPLENWKTLVMGINPDGEETVTVAIQATGLGKKSALDCIKKEMEADGKSEKDEWTIADDGKTFSNKEAAGFAVSDDLIVMTSLPLKDSVAELVAGKGKPASAGAMKALLARVDQTKPVWVSALIPAQFGGMAGATLGGTPTDVTMTADFSSGLALHVAVGIDKPADVAKKAQTEWDKNKALLGTLGVPQTIADSVKIGAADKTLTIDLSATDADPKSLTEMAKKEL